MPTSVIHPKSPFASPSGGSRILTVGPDAGAVGRFGARWLKLQGLAFRAWIVRGTRRERSLDVAKIDVAGFASVRYVELELGIRDVEHHFDHGALAGHHRARFGPYG